MIKLYGLYGILIILMFGFAAYQGYAFNSLFGEQQHSGQSRTGSSSNSYHK
jgi:hypothetical protein